MRVTAGREGESKLGDGAINFFVAAANHQFRRLRLAGKPQQPYYVLHRP